jgi:hypothetical protein
MLTHHDHFVPYAKSYADSTFILILHHIQINVIPKYMLQYEMVGTKWLWYEMTIICSIILHGTDVKETGL